MRRFAPAALAVMLVLGAAAPAGAANRWVQKRAPLNIAHQGGEDEFPSNTLYAFRKAVRAGADMLELDIGVNKDGEVIVMHDTTVDGKTNGHGTVASKTLRQIKRLDAAYWFAPARQDHYGHDHPARAYRFRGIATGRRPAPKGFTPADFRVPTLTEVMKAFPHTPINVEIKGRTPDEDTAEYVKNAEVLARLLKASRRRDLIVVSFQQDAVDRFHALAPKVDLAPGILGVAKWLGMSSPGPGVVAFQVPITFQFGGQLLEITSAENVARAHREGYAWQNWFAGDDRDDAPTWRRLIDLCVDGTMTSRPRAYEKVLRAHKRPASCG
ncbi:MAG: glycerophosphodiester phosphodiesterase [Thermoleophilaceae bacterium]|nr:glycerophosphodiester phosphodiesterase [Thermoleophilaceae bacterium]